MAILTWRQGDIYAGRTNDLKMQILRLKVISRKNDPKKYHLLLSVLNDFTDKTEKHDFLDLPELVMYRKMGEKSTLMSEYDKPIL